MYLRHCLFILFATSFTLIVKSQTTATTGKKSALQGYYQLQNNKNLVLEIVEEDNTLKAVRLWDYSEIKLLKVSDLEYRNAESNFVLNFHKDSTGNINKVTRGHDEWNKLSGYKPEAKRNLNASEIKALESVLLTKAKLLAATINSNSPIEVHRFISEHFSESYDEEQKLDFKRRVQFAFRQTGGIEYDNTVSINSAAAIGAYHFKSRLLNNTMEFSIKLDNNNKIKLFNSRILSDNDEAKSITEKERTIKLRKTLEQLNRSDIFSGTVLVAKGDKILFEYACGEAIKDSHVKNNINTRFNLGSMNKMFTSLGIMQLVEKGKLSLNDPASKYLDTTWLPKGVAEKIKIHHLLSHTSGLGDMFSKSLEQSPKSLFSTLEGYKPFIKVNKLAFEPGKDWSYSNAGMLVLGAIIEKVSGKDYFDYIKENIYKPSNMNYSSGKYDVEAKPTNVAIGYIPELDGSYQSNINDAYTHGTPAGGGYSNVRDLHRYALALMSGKLVSDSSRANMFRDVIGRQYGYGFQIWDTKDKKIIGHTGGAPGISAAQYILPESGYIIVVLSNYDRGSYYVGEAILKLVSSLEIH